MSQQKRAQTDTKVMLPTDAYDYLKLPRGEVRADVVRRQYHMLSLECHPDRGGDDESMQVLNEAYEVLKGVIASVEASESSRFATAFWHVPLSSREAVFQLCEYMPTSIVDSFCVGVVVAAIMITVERVRSR